MKAAAEEPVYETMIMSDAPRQSGEMVLSSYIFVREGYSHRAVGRRWRLGSSSTMKAAAEEPVYENMIMSDAPRQSGDKGNLPESSPKRSRVLYTLLLLLSLLLVASLGGVTAMYFQERQEKRRVAKAVQELRDFWKENSTVNMSVPEQTDFQEQQEKHRVAEAVQRIRDFWKENSTVNVSVLEQTGQQLVGEIQPLRGLWEEIISPCAVLQEQYHFQERREKRRVAEAVQGIRDFWKQKSTVKVSVLEQTGQQLVGEIQPLRGLWEEIVSPCAVLQEQYRYLLTRVTQGWRHHGGNLYYFSKEKSSWEEAEQFCVSQNSHLSSVLSREEQEYLATELRGAYHWIGLSDREAEGSWRWVDGSKYTEGFWSESQPDNWDQGVGGTEDCVHLSKPRYETWNDANCALQHHWICKAALG
ncbi:C-type lectin domain family 4 member F-like [Alligator mississippiensis]|uniref:C-type lectin domain family 4 member F-like n=1 Tax=Alligator mississippiensis TaxID=8496 RepID=UPI002877C705|nr:C-type lectin domain family 4 member F-like [Alligator mississippiensis]